MALRNFWVEAKIDGRESKLIGGPRSKEGGLKVDIYQRDNGTSHRGVTVVCYERNGYLLSIVEIDGKEVGRFETKR